MLTQDDTFYALVDDWGLEWATSRDGMRWRPADRAPDSFALRSSVVEDDDGLGPSLDSYEDPGPVGPQEVCAGDGTCYRLVDRRLIERRTAGGSWATDLRVTPAERRGLAGACAGGERGILSSIALLDRDGGGHDVIASLGAGGVLQRAADGAWVGRSVPGVTAAPSPGLATAAERVVVVAMTPLWIAAMAVVFTVGRRRRWRSLTAALSLMAGGWLLAVVATAAYSQVTGTGVHPIRIGWWSEPSRCSDRPASRSSSVPAPCAFSRGPRPARDASDPSSRSPRKWASTERTTRLDRNRPRPTPLRTDRSTAPVTAPAAAPIARATNHSAPCVRARVVTTSSTPIDQ